MSVVPQIKRGPKRKVGHVIYGTPFDLLLHFRFLGMAVNSHTEFEVSSYTHSRDMEGIPKFKK